MIHPWLSKERELTQVQKPHANIGQDGWNYGILSWSSCLAFWEYGSHIEILSENNLLFLVIICG